MQKGIIISYVLVFGSIFLILLAALSGFILIQQRQSIQKIAWQESLEIAEAGINYYKWCLNNGVEADCQLQKTYYDSSGGVLGQFSLEIDSILNCGQITETTITSTGWTSIFPQIKRKVRVLYGRPSVAQYSYIFHHRAKYTLQPFFPMLQLLPRNALNTKARPFHYLQSSLGAHEYTAQVKLSDLNHYQ